MPILIIVAVLIKIDSKGPVFFRQVRVGKNRINFKIYKFRSMFTDTKRFAGDMSSVNKELSKEELMKLRGSFVTKNNADSRITKVGKFIRKTSIDELPQLLNVLLGDMSLVGPRPDTPIQEIDYTSEQWVKRSLVKPGITGLAQISGRSNLSLEETIRLDLEYVDKYSLKLYLKIIFKTFSQVILAKGTN
ncbi:sugar transferase [Pedobacter sp. CYS-01]|uniref:Sugar transferase n=2 Tax=Pedobacter montanisoli TaxID=2923277 RepID=A0ABS9ZSC6_9SPHI|nr:sugar transferase [Pedobacter montanisoli]